MVTYTRIIVDCRPQKPDSNRVPITVGGNLLFYPGELTTRTADLFTAKILWNSVLSTENAKFITADAKKNYLNTPLDRFEYMRMPLHLIPNHLIDQYKLKEKTHNGYIYMEIRK